MTYEWIRVDAHIGSHIAMLTQMVDCRWISRGTGGDTLRVAVEGICVRPLARNLAGVAQIN